MKFILPIISFFLFVVFLVLPSSIFAQATISPSTNPDINLDVRGWQQISTPPFGGNGLIDISGPTDPFAPSLTTLIAGNNSPSITSLYQVYSWDWATNQKGGPIQADYTTNWGVTMVGFGVNPGQTIQVPQSDYDIGGGYAVTVLYATDNSLTLHYGTEDSLAIGYTIQLENIAVDPQILALYNQANTAGRTSLPRLGAYSSLGKAKGREILVVMRDSGAFMDPRSRKDWWQKKSGASSNLQLTLGTVTTPKSSPGKSTGSLKSFPEESEEDCPKQDITGGAGGLPLYHKPSGEEQPAFNNNVGLNFASAVKGTHCGQTKSQPLLLEESVPFFLFEGPKCKTVLWSGSFKLSDEATDKFVIPFAKELGDYWAGKGTEQSQTAGVINQVISGIGGLFSGLSGSAMPPDSGVLKKLLSANYQDSLKCSFINYVRKKGGTSMYANFSVDGKKLTSIPCPPSVSGNNDQGANNSWRNAWGDTWAKLSLLPDEKSAGELKIQVCQDKMYNVDVAYPNVFRLGLAANELYKVFSAKDNQDVYYKQQKDERNLKRPLDQNNALAKALNNSTKSSLFASLVSFVKDLPTKIKSLVSSVFAQGSDPLEAGIEIIPGTPFNYSVYIRKTASGQQQYPGIIGDVQIYIPGGTPHTQNMLGNELRWDTTNPDTASFLPRVENEDQLRQLVLLFRADTIGFAPHEIKYKGGIAPSPSPGPIACGPNQCCETGSCSTSCTICNRGQKNPSDTTVWSQGYGTNGVDIGNPQVNFTFKIPDWNPPEPLPPDCRLIPCAPSNKKCILNADYCTPAGVCGKIACLKTNTRTVDIFNRVPFLASVWKQAAGAGTGFLNIFKSKDITGNGLNQSITGCISDTASAIDSSGTFVTNPAYSDVTYKFDQTSATGDITVSQSSPGQGQKGKITFYRLGGICDANKWVSEKLLNP